MKKKKQPKKRKPMKKRTAKKLTYCFTCSGTGYYLCNKGIVSCHVCGGKGKRTT